METHQSLIFGPVDSRRFGRSLGIDLSPNQKQCNFDCLYCELPKAKTLIAQTDPIPVDLYIDALQKQLIYNSDIDVITLTANGEPTLYPYLGELIEALKPIKKNIKLLILSNGSLVYKAEIAKVLCGIDIVKLSLDCVSKECFKRLDRIDKRFDSKQIVEGIIEFSKIFHGELVIEVLFVKGLNDNDEEIEKIYQVLKQINPTRVDIGSIDRPPAYDVDPISYEELLAIANKMIGMNVAIASRNPIKQALAFDEQAILHLLERRPLMQMDIENLFDLPSKEIFWILVESGKIEKIMSAGVVFYGTKRV